MRERMEAGDPYIADDPELGEASASALDLMTAYNATTARHAPLRRSLLELHFDPPTARELDALIEGLVLHQALSTDPMSPAEARHALRRITS